MDRELDNLRTAPAAIVRTAVALLGRDAMAMTMSGEATLPAAKDVVWAKLAAMRK